MKYRRLVSSVVVLLLLSGIALATEPTILEPPDGYATNDPSIFLSWEIDVGNQSGFEIYYENESNVRIDEDGCFNDDDAYATVNTYSDHSNGTLSFDETEGIYNYRITTHQEKDCWEDSYEKTDFITVTIDTTDPSLVSKNFEDGDDRVDFDLDRIELEFDGGFSGIDKDHTEQELDINPSIEGPIEWEDETLIINTEKGLDYSTEYSISVEAKDNAGNTNDFSWSFETDTPAEKIEIRYPEDKENALGREIDLEADVTDQEGNPVKGGSVGTTGVPGCSSSLEFKGGGRFGAKCEPTEEGEYSLNFTAEAAGKEVTETMEIEIVEEPPIDIEIMEPDLDESHPRGEELQFRVETTVEGEPHGVKEVWSDRLGTFDQTEEEHIWEKNYETSYEDELDQNFTVRATGTVIRERTDSVNRFLNLEPATLDVELNYFYNGEKIEHRAEGGQELEIRTNVKYPDGTPIEDLEPEEQIKGTLFIVDAYPGDEELNRILKHREDGEYRSNQTYRVGTRDAELRTRVDVEDEHGNTGTAEKTIIGPAGSPELTLTQPSPRKASPGQETTLRGYIENPDPDQDNIITDPEVTINNEPAEVAGDDHYEVDYKIPTDAEIGEEYKLDIEIEHFESTYYDEETLDIEPPEIQLDQERLEERGLRRYERITASVIYPNGEPVKEGEYHLEVDGENYTLNHNPETGAWETEQIDLGGEDRTVTLTAKGETENVEAETASVAGVYYTWEPNTIEWIIQTPIAIAGIMAAIIGAIIAIWYYFKRYRWIQEFKELTSELEKTFVEMDNAYRSYAKTHDSEKLNTRQGDIQSNQRSIREEIQELVEEHPFLKRKQKKKTRKVAEKSLKKLLSYHEEKTVGRRAWLLGLNNFQANKIQTEVRDKYADKIEKMKEKQEEEDKEEIKEKLVDKYGFKENRANSIVKYQEKRREKLEKINEMLEEDKKTHQIKPQIKKEIKIGDEEFQEYRAEELIKKAGGDIKLQEPEKEEQEKDEEEKEKQKPAKTKTGEKLEPKTGIEAKAGKETKKTTEEEKEKQKKKQEEMDKKKKLKALKEMIEILEQKGMTEEQIKQEIKQQAKENGIKPEKIEKLLQQIEEE